MTIEMISNVSMPAREPRGHKGTFGSVGVIGGSVGDRMMVGGPAFTAEAALRCGCGLAIVAAPEPILSSILELVPEATGFALPVNARGEPDASEAALRIDNQLSGARVLAIGPGFGVAEPQRQIVLRLVGRESHRLVIDADALNVLSMTDSIQSDFRAPAILTPHPGEYQRLAERLGLPASPRTPEQRLDAASLLASRLGVVVVLKGAETVVSDGLRAFVEPTIDPALATAGSGDVLTGLCAGFASQFSDSLDLFEAASIAVRVHAAAAREVCDSRGTRRLLSRELLQAIPAAIATFESVS
jgi:hydroxyethylthiazole kinase-like uncharacterized protein yjeF